MAKERYGHMSTANTWLHRCYPTPTTPHTHTHSSIRQLVCERAEKVRGATQRRTDDRQLEVIGRVEGKEAEAIRRVLPTRLR